MAADSDPVVQLIELGPEPTALVVLEDGVEGVDTVEEADAAVQAYVDEVVGFALFERWDLVWAAVGSGLNVNAQNSHGRTILHWAAFKRHAATVRLVLDRGGDPNVRDDRGVTPVWRAAWSGTAEILADLVAAGGDVNGTDFEGVAPLVVLVCNGEGDAADRLRVMLERPELDVLAEYEGKTAEQWATEKGNDQLAALLHAEVVARGLL